MSSKTNFECKNRLRLILVGGLVLSVVLSSTAVFEKSASAAFGIPIVSPPNKLVAKLGQMVAMGVCNRHIQGS